jgi:hypothetical protein
MPKIILDDKWRFFIENDGVGGVPKAAKNNQSYTSSKLSIMTRLHLRNVIWDRVSGF